ncbi:MAG TPA: ATP-dependent DNA ligase, partial [Cryomorphaceae bacterium]|nr:ATP-dependent DNA ligase [Cryomorphaceae bacterium]
KTNAKVNALVHYFNQADDADKIWCIALLSGKRPKRSVRSTDLREWCAELSGLPAWLVEETYHIVGDLAETISKVLPPPLTSSDHSLTYWMEYIMALGECTLSERKSRVIDAWNRLDDFEKFVFNKLMMGGFRMGISQKLMVRALSLHTGKDENELAHRIMGNWSPAVENFEELILEERKEDDLSKPYPFYLAYALENGPEEIGEPGEWLAEHKWDGIRGQLIVRGGQHYLWSRGEELITDKFPEFDLAPGLLPDGTVVDGEILPFKDGQILGFQDLQTRIGRKTISTAILKKAPVVMRMYDLLEWQGKDLRSKSQEERRQILETLYRSLPVNPLLQLSELIDFENWEELAKIRSASRDVQAEGIMLKNRKGSYQVGRKKGDWWKWKVEPLTIDAVMIYAMRGHGRRANLYTDYTFAVWKEDELVPFTKAYSGLTDAEFRKVDAFVKRNTIERFGPVRSVTPELVFEIAFEGIQRSKRHKSGVALRFPRMKRWRQDKPASEANTLDDLHDLLEHYGS